MPRLKCLIFWALSPGQLGFLRPGRECRVSLRGFVPIALAGWEGVVPIVITGIQAPGTSAGSVPSGRRGVWGMECLPFDLPVAFILWLRSAPQEDKESTLSLGPAPSTG